jgi:hypothetical protein
VTATGTGARTEAERIGDLEHRLARVRDQAVRWQQQAATVRARGSQASFHRQDAADTILALTGDLDTRNEVVVTMDADERTCHCGQPVVYGFDGDATHHRGMCELCDSVRCDAYPGECRQPTVDRRVYFCPTADANELATGGGFDVCCDRPDLHEPARPAS